MNGNCFGTDMSVGGRLSSPDIGLRDLCPTNLYCRRRPKLEQASFRFLLVRIEFKKIRPNGGGVDATH